MFPMIRVYFYKAMVKLKMKNRLVHDLESNFNLPDEKLNECKFFFDAQMIVPKFLTHDTFTSVDPEFKKEFMASLSDLYDGFGDWLARTIYDLSTTVMLLEMNKKTMAIGIYKQRDVSTVKLCSIYVAKDCRSMGVGSLLLRTLLERIYQSTRTTYLSMTIKKSLTEEVKFYQKNGFVVTGEKNNDEYRMMQELKSVDVDSNGVFIVPLWPKYFMNFLDITDLNYRKWTYLSRAKIHNQKECTKCVFYVTSPQSGIFGEADIKIVNSKAAIELKDKPATNVYEFTNFLFYPKKLELERLLTTKYHNNLVLRGHPQRIQHNAVDIRTFRQWGFSC